MLILSSLDFRLRGLHNIAALQLFLFQNCFSADIPKRLCYLRARLILHFKVHLKIKDQ